MSSKRKIPYEEKTLAEKKLDFRRHLRTYLVMSLFFIILDYYTSGLTWAIWPILGWGIGVALQALSLYGPLKDPEETHPTDTDRDFSGPLPDLRDYPSPNLPELDQRSYRDEDLV